MESIKGQPTIDFNGSEVHKELRERGVRFTYDDSLLDMEEWVFGLKSAIDIKVFVYLLKLADVNGNVNLTSISRKALTRFLSISMQQLTNSLMALKSKKLVEGSREKYELLL